MVQRRQLNVGTPGKDCMNMIAGMKGIMLISAGELTQFTVSCFEDSSDFQARYVRSVEELQASSGKKYAQLDAAHRGLEGIGSCGHQTLPEYQVNGGSYEINSW